MTTTVQTDGVVVYSRNIASLIVDISVDSLREFECWTTATSLLVNLSEGAKPRHGMVRSR
jgi:hypothetical protein